MIKDVVKEYQSKIGAVFPGEEKDEWVVRLSKTDIYVTKDTDNAHIIGMLAKLLNKRK